MMMPRLPFAGVWILACLVWREGTLLAADGVATGRPRVVATTDGEIDDRCSMVRFLLYANEWDIEGADE